MLKQVYSKAKHKIARSIGNKKQKNKFYQLNFKFLGEASNVSGKFIVLNPKYISIGKNFSSLYNLRIEAWDYYDGERFHPEVIIGDNVGLNTDCHIGCINQIIIGNNVLIASRVYISDHSHGNTTKESIRLPPVKRPLVSKGPVVVEDNVWIGEGVCILPGVRIGRNSIIGANAVVTKDVPSNSVVGRIPAKVLMCLDNDDSER